MTREEAIEILSDKGLTSFFGFVNRIYDDFESRTCESCKHCVKYESMEIRECNLLKYIDSESTFSYIEVDKDFCCNKWESKNEN